MANLSLFCSAIFWGYFNITRKVQNLEESVNFSLRVVLKLESKEASPRSRGPGLVSHPLLCPLSRYTASRVNVAANSCNSRDATGCRAASPAGPTKPIVRRNAKKGRRKGNCKKNVINCRELSQNVLRHSLTTYDALMTTYDDLWRLCQRNKATEIVIKFRKLS